MRIKEAQPNIGIVLLSNFNEPSFMQALQHRRATGWAYLLKNSLTDVATLRRALSVVASGEVMVDPAVVAILRARNDSAVSAPDSASARSARIDRPRLFQSSHCR